MIGEKAATSPARIIVKDLTLTCLCHSGPTVMAVFPTNILVSVRSLIFIAKLLSSVKIKEEETRFSNCRNETWSFSVTPTRVRTTTEVQDRVVELDISGHSEIVSSPDKPQTRDPAPRKTSIPAIHIPWCDVSKPLLPVRRPCEFPLTSSDLFVDDRGC